MADDNAYTMRHLRSFENFDLHPDSAHAEDGDAVPVEQARAFVAALSAALHPEDMGARLETQLDRETSRTYKIHMGTTDGNFDDFAIEGTVEVDASIHRASFRGSHDQPADDDEVTGEVHITYEGVTFCGDTVLGVESLAADEHFKAVSAFLYRFADDYMDKHGIYYDVAEEG